MPGKNAAAQASFSEEAQVRDENNGRGKVWGPEEGRVCAKPYGVSRIGSRVASVLWRMERVHCGRGSFTSWPDIHERGESERQGLECHCYHCQRMTNDLDLLLGRTSCRPHPLQVAPRAKDQAFDVRALDSLQIDHVTLLSMLW